MYRKILGAFTILLLSFAFVVADEFKGQVTKVDGSKITVKNKAGDEKEFDITGAKVQKKGKDGNTAAAAADIKEKSGVTITHEGKKVSEVVIGGGKKAK